MKRWWPAGLVAIATMLAYFAVWVTDATGLKGLYIVLAAQLVVSVGGIVLIRLTDGHISIFNPAVLLLTVFPILYFWPALQLVDGHDPISRMFAPWLVNDIELQTRAARVALAGLVAVCVGYVAGGLVPLRPRRVRRRRLSASGHVRLGTTSFIGIALFGAFLLSVGGLGPVLDNLSNRTVFNEGLNYFGSGPVVVGAAGVARMIADRRWPPTLPVRLVLASSLLLTLLSGSKAVIAIFVIAVAAIVHYRHRKLSVLLVASAAIAASFALVTYDLYFRDAIPNNRPLTAVLRDNGGIVQALQTQFLGGNAFGHQALAIAIHEFPAHAPYQRFKTIEAFALAPVPRRLYPEKPSAPSATFTETFAPNFLRQGSSIPPTAFGEMYMCFGLWGVVVGAAFLGLLLNLAYRVRLFGDAGLLLSVLVTADVLHFMRGETYGAGVLFLLIWLPARWSLGRRSDSDTPSLEAESRRAESGVLV